MNAIIPAAGVGTRLRPHTHSVPKALLPVAGKPVLAHILDELDAAGVGHVVLAIGYLAKPIEEWVRDTYSFRISVVHQTQRRGLGHAILTAREVLASGPAKIILGDTIIKGDLASFFAKEESALGLKEVEDPRRFGVAEVEGGRITRLVEKPEHPASSLALVGLYGIREISELYDELDYMVANDLRTRGEFQLTDGLQRLIEKGEVIRPFMIDDWFDVGKPDAWLETNRVLLEGADEPPATDGVELVPPLALPEDAVVEDCHLGPNVSVGKGCVLRRSTIANSVLADGCVIEDCELHDSLLGEGVRLKGLRGRFNLGAGCQAAID